MSTYVVGDIQGCYRELKQLLENVQFNPNHDQLIAAGDMINRGPDNLSTLKLLQDLDALCVLGNHDLHFLAVAAGFKKPGKSDTLDDLLESSDLSDITTWLRQHPLILNYEDRNIVIAHAGIPHTWSAEDATNYASEVQEILKSSKPEDFFQHMYGNEPANLTPEVTGMTRLRVITNYLTRMRFCNQQADLELSAKANIAPRGYAPWFTFPRQDATRIVFGHWAAIEGVTNSDQFIAIDTGCIWGRQLTALRLEDHRRFAVEGYQRD